MVWRVALTDKAEGDLEATVAFLAGFSPVVAERIGLELVEIIFSLDQLPHRGAPVRARPGLRKLSHRYYLIYYRVDESNRLVEIVRIWTAEKILPALGCPDGRTPRCNAYNDLKARTRVAKLEAGESIVSFDLLVRAMLATGANSREIGQAIVAGK